MNDLKDDCQKNNTGFFTCHFSCQKDREEI